MNNYFVAQVNAIVDVEEAGIITITGFNFNPNSTQNHVEKIVRERYPESKIALVISSHRDISLEEYNQMNWDSPSWLIPK